jgi:RNA polymerase sigma factor (sigma-70 family)
MFYYLKIYRADEPVNRNTFTKHRKVLTTISEKFIDKIIVDQCIDSLPYNLRQVMTLYIKYDIPIGEIAAILGIHRNTVTNRIKRGIKCIDKFVQK